MSKNNNGNIKQTNVPARRKDHHQRHHHNRRSQFNPASDSFIYERCTDTHSTSTGDDVNSAQGLSSEASSDADDEDDITKSAYPSTKHNIRKRLQQVQQTTNINNNNYTELRTTRTSQPLSNIPNTATSAAAPSVKCSGKRFYAMAASRFAQEDIVFTDNQIYIGLKEMMNAQNSTATNRAHKRVDKTPFNMVSNMDTQNQGIHKNYAKTFHESSLSDQILFEKVKYDANKRYLQTSPVSTSSATSSRLADIADPISYRAFLYDPASQPRTSSMYVNDERDTSFTQHWPSRRKSAGQPRQGARLLRNEVPGAPDYNWQNAYDNDNGYVEQNSILDNHRNRIRSSSPTPVSPHHQSPPPGITLDTLMNNNYGTNGAYYYERASASFSRRSSISTTETWVDDESFDNSFNEELEKRCEAVCCR